MIIDQMTLRLREFCHNKHPLKTISVKVHVQLSAGIAFHDRTIYEHD
jgi:hypothetical protein